MPAVRFVTFDCAGTLIDVDWRPAEFAADCVERHGIPLDRPDAVSTYTRLLQTRWRTYMELNLTRDEAVCDGFWKELTYDWMAACRIEEKWLEPILAEAWDGLYGTKSRVFRLYPDTLAVLIRLKERGIRVGALSNWDYSLHRVVRMLGLEPHLDVVVASLEEGVEKPHPRIFEIALERLGADREETIHVGDSPLDDVQGALNAGLRAVLLDRESNEEALPKDPVQNHGVSRIAALSELLEVLEWIG